MESQLAGNAEEMISIKKLSELVGYSEDEIVKELFDEEYVDGCASIPIQQLRSAMIRFLDRTLVDDGEVLE